MPKGLILRTLIICLNICWLTGTAYAQQVQREESSWNFNSRGLLIHTPDNETRILIGGMLQIDARNYFDEDALTLNDRIFDRRARPNIRVILPDGWSVRYQSEFSTGDYQTLDMFVEKQIGDFSLRVGKFKNPIGFERLWSGAETLFIERGMQDNFVPNRDAGVQLSYEAEDWEAQFALMHDMPDDAEIHEALEHSKPVWVARVYGFPLRDIGGIWKDFGVGLGSSYSHLNGDDDNPHLDGDYRTVGQNRVFRYRPNVVAKGNHLRLSPQGYWTYDNHGLFYELSWSDQEVSNGVQDNDLQQYGWQIAYHWVMTGESAAQRGAVTPKTSVFQGGDGAWALTARVGAMHLDEDSFPFYASANNSVENVQNAGVGLTWFLNQNVKIMSNYDYSVFEGGAAGGQNRDDENAFFTRLQFRL